jgi:hypothetical protein
MVEPLRHRQTRGAATDMPGLLPPRHIPTLPLPLLLIDSRPRRLDWLNRVRRNLGLDPAVGRLEAGPQRLTRRPA